MFRNSIRFDLSDYLIHFFRRVNLESESAPIVPESMGFSNIEEDVNWSAIFMLRSAIRHSLLWATWSYRKDRRTIYGPSPAVCFTEMPLAAFLEAGDARERRGEAMSPYALVFPKKGLYNLGANPVIYGLDFRDARLPKGNNGGPRIIDRDILPEREQYRYVAFNPSANATLDWSHEREWRWPFRGSLEKFEKEIEKFGTISEPIDIPGLDISSKHCRGMGVVVKNEIEASWIASDILALVDRKIIDQSHYHFIIHADALPCLDDIRSPEGVSAAIDNATIDLQPFFSIPEEIIKKMDSRFTELVMEIDAKTPIEPDGEHGGVWLWLLDNTHDLTRSLLFTGRVSVSKDGRYLAELPGFSSGRALRQREDMAKELAERIQQEFSVESGYFSVLGKMNYDEVPFYNGNHIDNRMFYNVSWE
jgi:hypothetical protein